MSSITPVLSCKWRFMNFSGSLKNSELIYKTLFGFLVILLKTLEEFQIIWMSRQDSSGLSRDSWGRGGDSLEDHLHSGFYLCKDRLLHGYFWDYSCYKHGDSAVGAFTVALESCFIRIKVIFIQVECIFFGELINSVWKDVGRSKYVALVWCRSFAIGGFTWWILTLITTNIFSFSSFLYFWWLDEKKIFTVIWTICRCPDRILWRTVSICSVID